MTQNPRCQLETWVHHHCPSAESCPGDGSGSALLLCLSFSTCDGQMSWEGDPFSTLLNKCLLLLFPYIYFRLDNNQFKDNVMELLGSMLSVKDCQIQKLR